MSFQDVKFRLFCLWCHYHPPMCPRCEKECEVKIWEMDDYAPPEPGESSPKLHLVVMHRQKYVLARLGIKTGGTAVSLQHLVSRMLGVLARNVHGDEPCAVWT